MPVVEDWEAANTVENVWNQPYDWSIVSPGYTGSKTVRSPINTSYDIASMPGDGLSDYPSQGSTISVDFSVTSSTTSSPRYWQFWYCVTSTRFGSNPRSGYYVRFYENGSIVMHWTDGFNYETLASGTTNESYELPDKFTASVDWDESGGHTLTLYKNGSQTYQLSGTHTTYTSGGIGFSHQDAAVIVEYDNVSVEPPASSSSPQSATAEVGWITASALSPAATTTTPTVPQSAGLDVGLLTAVPPPVSASIATQASDVTRGLVSRWHFDGDLTDSEGTNNGSGSVSYASGSIDDAVLFNGSNLVEVADDATLDASEFTVAFRAYPVGTSSGTSDIHVYAGKDNGYTDRMFWVVQWDGIWQARVGSNAQTVSGPTVQTNSWVHVGLTYDGSTFTLYIDGEPVGSNTEPTLGGNSASMTFGAESPGNRHVPNGTMVDDGRFHNVALTDAEMVDVAAYDGASAPASMSASAEVGWLTATSPPPASAGGPVAASGGVGGLSASVPQPSPSPGAVAPTLGAGVLSSSVLSPTAMTGYEGVLDVGSLSASGVSAVASGGPVAASGGAGTLSAWVSTPTSPPGAVASTMGAGQAMVGATSPGLFSGATGAITDSGSLVASTASPIVSSAVVMASMEVGPASLWSNDVYATTGDRIVIESGVLSASGMTATTTPGPVSGGLAPTGPLSLSSSSVWLTIEQIAEIFGESLAMDSPAMSVDSGLTEAISAVGTLSITTEDPVFSAIVSGKFDFALLSMAELSPAASGGNIGGQFAAGTLSATAFSPSWEYPSLDRIVEILGVYRPILAALGQDDSTVEASGRDDSTRDILGTK